MDISTLFDDIRKDDMQTGYSPAQIKRMIESYNQVIDAKKSEVFKNISYGIVHSNLKRKYQKGELNLSQYTKELKKAKSKYNQDEAEDIRQLKKHIKALKSNTPLIEIQVDDVGIAYYTYKFLRRKNALKTILRKALAFTEQALSFNKGNGNAEEFFQSKIEVIENYLAFESEGILPMTGKNEGLIIAEFVGDQIKIRVQGNSTPMRIKKKTFLERLSEKYEL